MELLVMVPKNQRLPRMETSKFLKHQANKTEPRIMMMGKIKSQRAVNSQRNQKSVENNTDLFIIM